MFPDATFFSGTVDLLLPNSGVGDADVPEVESVLLDDIDVSGSAWLVPTADGPRMRVRVAADAVVPRRVKVRLRVGVRALDVDVACQNKSDSSPSPGLAVVERVEVGDDFVLLAGWAHDWTAPDEPIELVLRTEDYVVGRAVASNYRHDLSSWDFRGGHCSFSIAVSRRVPFDVASICLTTSRPCAIVNDTGLDLTTVWLTSIPF